MNNKNDRVNNSETSSLNLFFKHFCTFLVVSCHFKNSDASLPPFSYSESLQRTKLIVYS